MGKFTDTRYTSTMDNLIESINKDQLQNPYLKFSDKRATKVTYYKQNLEKTTTDEGTQDVYQTVGSNSSIKYNKINGFFLYGIDQVDTIAEMGDWGLEAQDISGDAVILPKTITPTSGDYFIIPYLKENLLFRVNEVQQDTFYHGNNFFKISYKLEKSNAISQIEEQVVAEYNFIFSNVGTDFSAVISSTSTDMINKLDSIISNLTSMFEIFFDNNVQNFVFTYNGFHMYDPYLIEFILRNNLMASANDYIYVSHGTPVQKTFSYDYSRSWFKLIEDPTELDNRDFNNFASATAITELNTLFVTRLITYYKVDYASNFGKISAFPIFPSEVLMRIKSGEYFTDSKNSIYNLLIAHLNNDESYFTGAMMDEIRNIEYSDNKEFFYLIPVYIFILNKYAEKLMK